MQKFVFLGLLLGIVCAFFPIPGQEQVASGILLLFTNALKLVSLPIIFLSLLLSLIGFEEKGELKWMGKNILRYTLLTTVIAAGIALMLFLLIDPVSQRPEVVATPPSDQQGNYFTYLLQVVPSNFFEPFISGNVMAVLFLAVVLGMALLHVPGREKVHAGLKPILEALMKVTRIICFFIPLSVWAGVVLSFQDLKDGALFSSLSLYLLVVVGANILQGIAVLPILLKLHGFSPWKIIKGFFPALSVAFFSKSSVASIPVAIRCAEDQLGISSKVSKFTFPICTTINMNGCAAFILTTVLYVSMCHGMHFSPFELFGWIFIATLAAVGNAGVPMGCYFLSSALLASMNVPLEMLALILPFYSLLDMIETALNVFSDGCVALFLQRKVNLEQHQETTSPQTPP